MAAGYIERSAGSNNGRPLRGSSWRRKSECDKALGWLMKLKPPVSRRSLRNERGKGVGLVQPVFIEDGNIVILQDIWRSKEIKDDDEAGGGRGGFAGCLTDGAVETSAKGSGVPRHRHSKVPSI